MKNEIQERIAEKKEELKRYLEQINKAKDDIRKYENDNKLLYFNHPDKGYLGKYGSWEENPLQSKYFEALRDPRYKVFMYTGSNRIAKAQYDEELVITNKGPKKMKDIRLGDYVMSQDGQETKVTGVYPQGEVDAYRVTFDDGRSLTVAEDHLWLTQSYHERFKKKLGDWKTPNKRHNKWSVKTTKQIIEIGKYNPSSTPQKRHIIPACEPINFERQSVKLDPYVLGVLLMKCDMKLIPSITIRKPRNYVINELAKRNIYMERRRTQTFLLPDLFYAIRRLGLLDAPHNDRFIPDLYKYNNIAKRKKLILGVLDSSGIIDGHRKAPFIDFRSKRLRSDFRWMIESMGGKCTEYTTSDGFFRLNVYLYNGKQFSFDKKWRAKTNYKKERIIYRIEKLDKKLPMTCIKVDHYSHLYLAQHAIVTHNTFSTTGVTALTALRGCYPWEDPKVVGTWFWNIHEWKPPIKVLLVGQGWDQHVKQVVVPTLEELVPKSWNLQTRKNNVGVDAYWYSQEGRGSINIMSNKSESKLFEGAKNHIVIYDEPPKRDVRIACARGLIDYNGIEIFAMTHLNEPWILADVMNKQKEDGTFDKSIFILKGKMSDNVGHGISEKGMKEYADKLSPDEYRVRVLGESAFQSALVLNINRQKHVINRFNMPACWMIDIGIDIGISKPHDILYVATAENGYKYVCYEQTLAGDGHMIADSIIKKKQRFNLRINRIVCDPLAKGSQEGFASTWEQINDTLHAYGMFIEKGAKDKEDGVLMINNILNTIHNQPALFFFEDCVKAVKQCMFLMREEESPGVYGKISKKDDDMFENLYRIILLGTEYEDPDFSAGYSYSNYSYGNPDSITGY